MRPIHLARLDKMRPVLVLTREVLRPHVSTVTVAPITTTIRGLSTEVELDARNGLDDRCVVACDHVPTIPAQILRPHIRQLRERQEGQLRAAIPAAIDFD